MTKSRLIIAVLFMALPILILGIVIYVFAKKFLGMDLSNPEPEFLRNWRKSGEN